MPSSMRRNVYIVGCKRTAIGAMGGSLAEIGSVELGQIAAKAALEAANVCPKLVDSVIVGNILQDSQKNGPYIARHVALGAGVDERASCLTVNRLCGSGIQAVVNGIQDILLHDSEIALAVGTESMSQAPFLLRDTRFGVKFGSTPTPECALKNVLTDFYVDTPMIITAENVAEKYGITREDCDKMTLLSNQRWAAANKAGKFKKEIVPIKINVKGKEVIFDVDELPRPEVTMEDLKRLSPVMKANGVVTPAGASGLSDAAAALVLASEDAVKKHNLKPMARIVGYMVHGCDPKLMGIGPVEAIRKLCERYQVSLDEIDLFDINEAFAPQFLGCQKDLKLDIEKTNVNGGALAHGHPLAATGAKVLCNLVYELIDRRVRYGIGSACLGGGQGIAVLFENIN